MMKEPALERPEAPQEDAPVVGECEVSSWYSLDLSTRRWRQHLATILASLSIANAGMAIAGTGLALDELESLGAMEEEASWVGACLPLGALVGALPAGAIADRFGRRWGLIGVAPLFVAGWLMNAFADVDKLWLAYLGRSTLGLAIGPSFVFVPIYCEEVAEVSTRGQLGTHFELMLGVGHLLICVLCYFCPFFWYSLCGVGLAVIFLITFWWMPESPVHLVAKRRTAQASKALQWLRGAGLHIDDELDELATVAAVPAAASGLLDALSRLHHFRPLRSPTWCALTLSFLLVLFQQLNGINAYVIFTSHSFAVPLGAERGSLYPILVGSLRVALCLVALLLVERLGRRMLLLASAITMSMTLVMFTLYSHIHQLDSDTVPWVWGSLLLYFMEYPLGFGPLPFLIMTELVPLKAKGWVASFTVSFYFTWLFIITKFFPAALEALGPSLVYGFFSAFCFLSVFFVGIFIPETKGKSKLEIQENLLDICSGDDEGHKNEN